MKLDELPAPLGGARLRPAPRSLKRAVGGDRRTLSVQPDHGQV